MQQGNASRPTEATTLAVSARSTSDPVSLVTEPLHLVAEDKIEGEPDQDAVEAASVTTAGGSPNAPIMPPASDLFLDERDSALARTHNYCVHPSARPICAHLIAHRHDLSLTDGTGRFAQHLTSASARCSRVLPWL